MALTLKTFVIVYIQLSKRKKPNVLFVNRLFKNKSVERVLSFSHKTAYDFSGP